LTFKEQRDTYANAALALADVFTLLEDEGYVVLSADIIRPLDDVILRDGELGVLDKAQDLLFRLAGEAQTAVLEETFCG